MAVNTSGISWLIKSLNKKKFNYIFYFSARLFNLVYVIQPQLQGRKIPNNFHLLTCQVRYKSKHLNLQLTVTQHSVKVGHPHFQWFVQPIAWSNTMLECGERWFTRLIAVFAGQRYTTERYQVIKICRSCL